MTDPADKAGDPADDPFADPFLAAARAARPQPSGRLTARVLEDARSAQPAPAAPAPRPARAGRGLWAALAEAFGGAGVLAGLGTAMVAGLWLGYAAPPGLDWLSGVLAPAGEVDLLQADDLFLTEG